MVWVWLLSDFPPPCFFLAYLSPNPPPFLQFLEGAMFISILGSFVSAWNVLPHISSRLDLLFQVPQLSLPEVPLPGSYHHITYDWNFHITCLFTYYLLPLVSGSPMKAGTCWLVPCCTLTACHCACSITNPWRSTCHSVALWGKCVGQPSFMRPTENAGPPHLSLWQDEHFLALWPHYLLLYVAAQNFAYPP